MTNGVSRWFQKRDSSPRASTKELVRGAVTERLVQALVVVEFEVGGDAVARLRHVVVGLEIDFLVLEAAPQPFHEDVVGKAAAAVHADRHPVAAQHAST